MSTRPPIRAGKASSVRPSPALPPNVLSADPRPETRLYDCAQGPSLESHDNEDSDFRRIRILPSTDEILAVRHAFYIPKKDLRHPNPIAPSAGRLQDLLFRQLRYDSIESVRDICYSAAQTAFLANSPSSLAVSSNKVIPSLTSVLDLSSNLAEDGIQYIKQETLAGNRYFLYRDVDIEEMVAHEQKSALVRISYDCPRFMRGRFLHQTGRFEEGMLLALLCNNNDTGELDISFLQVHAAQSTDSMKPRGGAGHRAAVLSSVVPDVGVPEFELLAKLAQKRLPNSTLVMVEFPKLLHAGFYNCLKRLQGMKTFAFDKYIAPIMSNAQIDSTPSRTRLSGGPASMKNSPPSYAIKPGFTYNLMSVGKAKDDELLREFSTDRLSSSQSIDELRAATIFDHGQAAALQHCLVNEFAFVQGPPGTGKTFLGIHLTRVLLASRRSTKPILVVCLTNHALDSFLGGLKDAGVKRLLRIGGGSKEEWTDAINLRRLNQKNRLSPRELHKTFQLKNAQHKEFENIQNWCTAQSAWALSGKASWYALKDIIALHHPTLFEQFQSVVDSSYLRINVYEIWASGGDISKIRLLKSTLSTVKAKNDQPSPPMDENDDFAEEMLNELYHQTERQHVELGSDSIWRIPPPERKNLIDGWSAKIDFDLLSAKLSSSFVDHQDSLHSIQKIKSDRNLRTMLDYDVIGITTTGCASRWELLEPLDLEIVICEEAGEVMEAHALCFLLSTIQHAVFIGDPLQLRPEVQERPMSLECTGDYRLDESLFERMVMPRDPASSAVATEHLTVQRRMHPDIANITRLTYPFLLDDPSTRTHPGTAGIDRRIFWWDHRVPELEYTGVSKSQVNPHEVAMVRGLVNYLLKTNVYSPGDIAVLTPYAGQLAALHESLAFTCPLWLSEKDRALLLDEELLDIDELTPRKKDDVSISELLRVTTVDNFQGEEAKVVILSTVRSGGKPGFLAIHNRINVACSRAKDGFYVVGNSETLRQVPMWRDILEVFKNNVGFGLTTHCDRHQHHRFTVYRPEDFSYVLDCPVICGYELPCGHSCDQICHSMELHVDSIMPCLQPCLKVLDCGHQCLRICSINCGACLVATGDTVLECGHQGHILCSGEISRCMHILNQRTLDCDHIVDVRCGDSSDAQVECIRPCPTVLDCGHGCVGICDGCQKEGHSTCSEDCGMALPCGHTCRATCGHESGCPPCEVFRETKCEHGIRKYRCGTPPEPCLKLRHVKRHDADTAQILCCLPTTELPQHVLSTTVLSCGHIATILDVESTIPHLACPLCKEKTSSKALIHVPECGHMVEAEEIDRENMSQVYELDGAGVVVKFKDFHLSELRQPVCSTCGITCSNVVRYKDLSRLVELPRTINMVIANINATIKSFGAQLAGIERGLDASFEVFIANFRPGILAWDSNHDVIARRMADAKHLQHRIAKFNEEVVKPFENHLTTISRKLRTIPRYSFTASLRLEVLDYRYISMRLTEHMRIAKHLLLARDSSGQTQRIGNEICDDTQTQALTCLSHGLPEFLETNRLSLSTSPSLDVEFRLREVFLWLTAYNALEAMDSKSITLKLEGIPRLVESLSTAIDIVKHFPSTRSFLESAMTYKVILREISEGRPQSSGKVPKIDCSSVRRLEKCLGTSDCSTAEFDTCAKAGHPHDKTLGECLECGVRVDLANEVYTEMKEYLREDDFLAAMRKILVGTGADSEAEGLVDTKTEDTILPATESFVEDAVPTKDEVVADAAGATPEPTVSDEEKFLAAIRMVGKKGAVETVVEVSSEMEEGTMDTTPAVIEWREESSPSVNGAIVVIDVKETDVVDVMTEDVVEESSPGPTDEEKFLAAMHKMGLVNGVERGRGID